RPAAQPRPMPPLHVGCSSSWDPPHGLSARRTDGIEIVSRRITLHSRFLSVKKAEPAPRCPTPFVGLENLFQQGKQNRGSIPPRSPDSFGPSDTQQPSIQNTARTTGHRRCSSTRYRHPPPTLFLRDRP